jgi:integrase
MSRSRHQDGWVEETGKTVKKWKGHYYVYVRDDNGRERREHRSVMLGAKSEMRKWEAQGQLRQIIEREAGISSASRPSDRVTLEWFWQNRFEPIQTWRKSTRAVVTFVMKQHVLPRFGQIRLKDLTRFDLQAHVNEFAKSYSESLVKKVRVWLKAVLEEAVEQDYLGKNPARKLVLPETRDACTRFLTIEEYQRLLSVLNTRDRLIIRLFVICAFRPGELFALRWGDYKGHVLNIRQAVYRGQIGKTKTKGSAAEVVVPQSLQVELNAWYEECSRPAADELIFPSKVRKPLDAHNYLQRDVLKPAAEKAGIKGVTFQSLRRTFGSHFHGVGTVKDQQAQMRHSNASTTMNIYTQPVSESRWNSIEEYDRKMSGGDLNTIEHEQEGRKTGND